LAYRIEFAPRAERDLKSLDGSIRRRIARRIQSLADNPYPQGIKKIEGEEELYRLRVGDYRILYQVQRQRVVILVVGIGHRRDIYRRIGG